MHQVLLYNLIILFSKWRSAVAVVVVRWTGAVHPGRICENHHSSNRGTYPLCRLAQITRLLTSSSSFSLETISRG
ncbi:hypothetical protein V8C34DRAFT_295066 [Trichoderma compactum]